MIWLFLLCLVVITALLQRSWADLSLKQLTYTMTWEPALAEPEEPITLTSRLENRGWLPVMYALLSENLPAGAKVLESGEWQREHLFTHAMGTSLRSATYLLPRRSRTGSVRIALPRRGWYPLGGATLYAGDFLGLKESTAYLNHTDGVVVIPRRAETPELLQALGGFLGDLSVRRFILEDPILTTGFREYTGREPMKAISWTQSARAGQLMVKQYDHTSEVRISEGCRFLSLSEPIESWVDNVLSLVLEADRSKTACCAAYDIRKSAADLQIRYEELVNRNPFYADI